jgi:L-rhamnose mutarotase
VITNERGRIQAEKTQKFYKKTHDASMPSIIIPTNIHKCGIILFSLFLGLFDKIV